MKKPTNIFIAYSREDTAYINKLRKYLFPLQRNKEIKIWYDGEIIAGTVWEAEIKKHLHAADIILLLVSSNSLYSEYFYDKEVKEALERHEEEKTTVIPVILGACLWEETPLKNLQVLPKDALPIDNWPNEADAYVNIVRGIRKSISIIQDRRKHILAISLAEKREREGQYQADSEKEKQERELQMAAEKKTPKKHQNSIKPALQKAIQHKRFRFGVTAVISLLMLLLLGNQFGFFWKKVKPFIEDIDTTKTTPKHGEALQDLVKNMVNVEGDTFRMGCDEKRDGDCEDNEKPVHEVTLSSYQIGKYEVTQAQWQAVMGNNPSSFKGCDNCPVEEVSWNDIQTFLQKLNSMTGKKFRLPTEAEWEYAARGGNKSKDYKYSGSNDIEEVAWYYSNSGNKTHEVGNKDKANELGIYDMSGNVWEWCEDWYNEDYYKNTVTNNPKNLTKATFRVLRGGSWDYEASFFRVAYRYHYTPTHGNYYAGFRLASSL